MVEKHKIVIESVRAEDGRKFRPSDWIERISANMGEFGPDHRLHYASNVHPEMIDGEKCLVIKRSLQQEDPSAFEYILGFAQSNGLRYRDI